MHYRDMATDRSDADLLSWVIEHAGSRSLVSGPRWSFVGAIFGLGSSSASDLCERFGHGPDEIMGGANWCECGNYLESDD